MSVQYTEKALYDMRAAHYYYIIIITELINFFPVFPGTLGSKALM